MTPKERKNITIPAINENSLNFELAKLKHRIQANCSLVSQNNLFIFTKERIARA